MLDEMLCGAPLEGKMMVEITQVIIWWAGAVLGLAALACVTGLLALVLKWIVEIIGNKLFRIAAITTAIYWVQRMEREGLTICKKDYRSMVRERKPKTIADFESVEAESKRRTG